MGFGSTIYTHGVPRVNLKLWKQIKVGNTKERVVQYLGSPTLISKFNKDIWYYVSYRIKQANFLGRRKCSSRSIQILFGRDGKVVKVEEISVSERRLVDLV